MFGTAVNLFLKLSILGERSCVLVFPKLNINNLLYAYLMKGNSKGKSTLFAKNSIKTKNKNLMT